MPGIPMLASSIVTDFFEGLWRLIEAIILGIIEGITEWLPISSTGHLMLAGKVLKPFGDNQAFIELFEVVVQLGAILAVCVIYFHKLNPWSKGKTPGQKHQTWILWAKVCLASIPIVIFVLIYEKVDAVHDFFHNSKIQPIIIACALIFYGIAFIVVENYFIPKRQPVNKFFKLTYRTAFFIGCIQVLSLIPGTSRSGVTILGAMLLGCTRRVSAEYTFFLGIPAMFGASGLKLLSTLKDMYFDKNPAAELVTELSPELASELGSKVEPAGVYDWFLFLVAMFVAFMVSMIAIRFLMDYVKRHNFTFFGWYRIALGVIVLIVAFTIGF